MDKYFIIESNEIATYVRVKDVLHLEVHQSSIFFSTKYADYEIRNAVIPYADNNDCKEELDLEFLEFFNPKNNHYVLLHINGEYSLILRDNENEK